MGAVINANTEAPSPNHQPTRRESAEQAVCSFYVLVRRFLRCGVLSTPPQTNNFNVIEMFTNFSAATLINARVVFVIIYCCARGSLGNYRAPSTCSGNRPEVELRRARARLRRTQRRIRRRKTSTKKETFRRGEGRFLSCFEALIGAGA
jgi:hypothetical protein